MNRADANSVSAHVVASAINGLPEQGDIFFKIKFGTGAGYRQTAPNSFSFHGKGEIKIERDAITISGKRHRMFRAGIPETHTFRSADVFNVRTNGKYVRFDVNDSKTNTWRQVGFIAANAQAANAIAAFLPTQQTQAFALDHAERSDFYTRLDSMSPGAPVTTGLVALNVIVFLLMALNGAGVMTPNPEVAIRWGSNYGLFTLDGQWWRLFTSTFIHFGIFHLALNMFALYQTGRMVERIYGSVHFLLLYVFAGLTGSMVSLLWHPTINSAGASGAIFGVFGGLLAFMVNRKNAVPRSIMNEHRNSTLAFIAFNLLNGFTHSGIDNGAHLGGLIGGIVGGFLLARPLEAAARSTLLNRRLILSCVIGIFLLGTLSYPLSHPSHEVLQERGFSGALRAFSPEEGRVLAEMNVLIAKVKQKSISQTDFAELLEKEIKPRWEYLHNLLADPDLPDGSKNYQIQRAMLRYVDYRQNSCQLIIDGIRKNDDSLIYKANEETEKSQREIAKIRKLTVR